MKKLLLILLSGVFFTSCTELDLEEQTIKVIELPGYVAFANSGGTMTPIVRNIAESSTVTQNLRIEVATGSLSDVTVTYSFSGTAVFGVDFTVVPTPGGSATAAGGAIIIRRNQTPSGTADFDFVNLGIRAVTDGVTDGNKTLIITLENAVNVEGKQFSVGRGVEGGTIYLKTATVNFSDVN